MKNTKDILGMQVDVSTHIDTLIQIKNWSISDTKCGHYICLSNVHMCMETYDDNSFQTIVNNADLVLADGKPIYWAQKLLGSKDAEQIRGSDLMLRTCEQAERNNTPVGLYGGSPEVLNKLLKSLGKNYPNLNIVCNISPPYRALTADEDTKYVDDINDSGAKILFVGLGCPKQELWMANHKAVLSCVMLGVGAAFDFIAGEKKSAPKMVSHLGLEWLHRLTCEPRRLWKRYLKHNPRFVFFFFKQWCFNKNR